MSLVIGIAGMDILLILITIFLIWLLFRIVVMSLVNHHAKARDLARHSVTVEVD